MSIPAMINDKVTMNFEQCGIHDGLMFRMSILHSVPVS